MRTRVFMLAAAIALCAPAAASAATVPVQQLNGDFSASNSTVTKTPDGVHFGTYADGGSIGGSLVYNGLNGRTLSDVTDFSYTFTYRQSDVPATTGAAPYARIFLDADGDGQVDNDVVLDPSFCATTTPDQATDLTYQMVGNSVRYSDDGCGDAGAVEPGNQPWAQVIDNHGGEKIVGLLVSQGFSTGHDVSALVRNITVNGNTFAFDVAPVGTPGPAGPAGPAGTTTIVQVPAAGGVLGVQVKSCKGDDLVTLHVPSRAGQRFLSARATLAGKRLKVRGRVVTVDLRGRASGTYDVRIVSRYRTRSGHVVTRVTHRVRSVACA